MAMHHRIIVSRAAVAVLLLGALPASAGVHDAWEYRQPITIANSTADALEQHQVLLAVDTAALIAANRLAADGSDLRFASADGATDLSYFIESGLGTASTAIWVRVPAIGANAAVPLGMYYGNAGVAAASNPHTTFDFWEDFSAPEVGLAQDCGGGTLTVADGKGDFSWSGSAIWTPTRGGPANDGLFPETSRYVQEVLVTAASGSWPGVYWANTENGRSYSVLLGGGAVRIGVSGNSTGFCQGQNWASALSPTPADVSGLWSLAWLPTGQIASFPNLGPLSSNDTLVSRNTPLRPLVGGISSGVGSMSIDSIRIRKYDTSAPTSTIEPAVSQLPGAPTIDGVTPGNTSASFAFTAPASDGGVAITSYVVTCEPGAISASTAASPLQLDGLVNGTEYTCTMAAVNAAGTGPASAPVTVIPVTVPGAPTDVAATPDGSISFTPPADTGGSAITGYTVACEPGGITGTGTQSPVALQDLVAGTTYTCTVTASNAQGNGPASAAVTFTYGDTDGGVTDGGVTDGGATDAGTSGRADAGRTDAGSSGASSSGSSSGGLDDDPDAPGSSEPSGGGCGCTSADRSSRDGLGGLCITLVALCLVRRRGARRMS